MPPSLIQRRDLHDGTSLWQTHRVPLPPRAALRGNPRCDVLIVGAGISGAMVADALSASGLHVILCDRRPLLQGSTAASTAMVLHEIDTPLSHLVKQLGRKNAERIWRRSSLAVHALRERARNLGFDDSIEDSDSLYLQGDMLDAHGLQREAAARTRAGFEVEYLNASQVQAEYGIRRRAGLRTANAFSADPRVLAAGMLRAAVARGAQLFSPEEVTEVHAVRGGVRAVTASGHRIAARHLVFATGYELAHCVPAAGHRIVSTWAIATVPQRRLPWVRPSLIWEASEHYLYLRTTADGRVLCGGGDEDFADATKRAALLESKRDWLQRRLCTFAPQVDARVAYAWGGSFGISAHGLPTIDQIPGMPRCYALLGYGGNGITFSMMGAQMLRNVLTGEGDEDLDLVRFRRAE